MDKKIQLDYWDVITTGKKDDDNPLWQGYTPDISDEKAVEDFIKKYGYEPEKQKRDDACVLVGPIFEEDKK